MKDILQEIYDFGGRYIVFPNEHSRVAWAAWVAHAPLSRCFRASPRLLVTAATKGCGKTTLADITQLLIPGAVGEIYPTAAAIYRKIAKLEAPTFIIDEVQELFAKKDIHDIVMIINSGFEQGKRITRIEQVGNEWVPKEYDPFSPMALVGIDKGNIPDTVLDRCITIRLKKKITAENIEPLDIYETPQRAQVVRDCLASWCLSVADKCKTRKRPEVPQGIEGRARNKWEPLFAIADLVDGTDGTNSNSGTGGGWGSRLRKAALEFLKTDQLEESLDHGQLALSHIRQIFEEALLVDGKISSYDLVAALQDIRDAPWSSFQHGKPLSQSGLAQLLRPYDIRTSKLRLSGEQAKGYYKADFDDAFRRYLPPLPPKVAVPGVPTVPTVPIPIPRF